MANATPLGGVVPSSVQDRTWSKCHGLPLAVLGTVTLLCWGPCVRAVSLAAPGAGTLICSNHAHQQRKGGFTCSCQASLPCSPEHPFPMVLSIPTSKPPSIPALGP